MTTENLTLDKNPAPSADELYDLRVAAFEKVFGEKYLDRFTDPIHFLNVEFETYKMHKFYQQTFGFVSRNIFAEYVYRRRAKYNRELLVHYSNLMSKKLDAVQAQITKFTSQIDAVIANNGGDLDGIGYVKQRHEYVPVIHAQARQYLDLLLQADRLVTKVAAATLQGLIDADAKTNIEFKIILTFRAIHNMIRSETVTLRKEALRVRHLMRDNDKIAVDDELDTAINMQSNSLEEGTELERENAVLSGVAFTETQALAEYNTEQNNAAAVASA